MIITELYTQTLGRWNFAYNRNVKQFDHVRQTLLEEISKDLCPYCLGEEDSEVVFHLNLSYIAKNVHLHENHPELKLVMLEMMDQPITRICEIIG